MAGTKLESESKKQSSRKRKHDEVAEAEPSEDRQTRRIRKGRACDRCHTAHQPCRPLDLEEPLGLCERCNHMNLDCTYAKTPIRRGPVRGYPHFMELAMAWLCENVPACKKALTDAMNDRSTLAMLCSQDEARAKVLAKSWKNSKILKDIHALLKDVKQSTPSATPSPSDEYLESQPEDVIESLTSLPELDGIQPLLVEQDEADLSIIIPSESANSGNLRSSKTGRTQQATDPNALAIDPSYFDLGGITFGHHHTSQSSPNMINTPGTTTAAAAVLSHQDSIDSTTVDDIISYLDSTEFADDTYSTIQRQFWTNLGFNPNLGMLETPSTFALVGSDAMAQSMVGVNQQQQHGDQSGLWDPFPQLQNNQTMMMDTNHQQFG